MYTYKNIQFRHNIFLQTLQINLVLALAMFISGLKTFYYRQQKVWYTIIDRLDFSKILQLCHASRLHIFARDSKKWNTHQLGLIHRVQYAYYMRPQGTVPLKTHLKYQLGVHAQLTWGRTVLRIVRVDWTHHIPQRWPDMRFCWLLGASRNLYACVLDVMLSVGW